MDRLLSLLTPTSHPAFHSHLFLPVGIPIRVHIFMPLLWAFMTLQGLTFGFNRYGLVAVSYFALLYGPVLWGTVLVHELGHAFVARRHGIPCSHILLWPLGGLAVLGPGSSPITANIDLKVALAGPFTHLPQFLIWYLVTFAFPGVCPVPSAIGPASSASRPLSLYFSALPLLSSSVHLPPHPPPPFPPPSGLSFRTPIFFPGRDSPYGQPSRTTSCQPPPTANCHSPTATNCHCFCGLVSCPCFDHEAESVPVNVCFCWRHEGLFFP